MSTFVVTGANSGLGFETARSLAGTGHVVVLAVRDRARGADAMSAIRAEHPSARLDLRVVDLADLDTVHAFAAELDAVDVLVNNAGVGSGSLRKTREGLTSELGTNHLGHFLLTALLWPKLMKGTRPRVVTVGSGFGRKGTLDLENLDASQGYSPYRAYAQSKLANALFASELDRRTRHLGTPILSILAHPGIAATPMQQKPTGLMGVAARLVSAVLARSPQNGALPLVEAATRATANSGDIYGPGRGRTDPPRLESRWPSFDDVVAARALWARSEALTRTPFLRDGVSESRGEERSQESR